MSDKTLVPYGDHISITSLTTAQSFTTPARSFGIYVQALNQNVRIVFGGEAATATNGFQIKADDPPQFIPLKPRTQVSVIEEIASAEFQWQPAGEM